MEQSKTKDEIIAELPMYSGCDFGLLGSDEPQYLSIESCEKAMETFANQEKRKEAIAFLQFATNFTAIAAENVYNQYLEQAQNPG